MGLGETASSSLLCVYLKEAQRRHSQGSEDEHLFQDTEQ